MRIGEVATRTGVPTKTIRYYEEIGILPAPSRTESGYRDYRDDAVARLRFVKAAQSIGLSLGEIKEILAFRDRGEVPCEHVASLIERHARELSERIIALERMRGDLERLAKRARAASQRSKKEARFCHIIERGVQRRKSKAGTRAR
jgi:DNA-binding transcriptional MerR regulator